MEKDNKRAGHFSNEALDAIDRLCVTGELSVETIESWQGEHMRTPYEYQSKSDKC